MSKKIWEAWEGDMLIGETSAPSKRFAEEWFKFVFKKDIIFVVKEKGN